MDRFLVWVDNKGTTATPDKANIKNSIRHCFFLFLLLFQFFWDFSLPLRRQNKPTHVVICGTWPVSFWAIILKLLSLATMLSTRQGDRPAPPPIRDGRRKPMC
jgi:hypothetical protein